MKWSLNSVLLIIVVITLFPANVSYAAEVKLSVEFTPQVNESENLGNWRDTMNCGPTSLVMAASYLRDFSPTTHHVKKLDDWLYENGLVPALNNYNLTKNGSDPGTSYGDLTAAAGYYYGLWNVEYSTLVGNAGLDLIHNSLSNGSPVIVAVRIDMTVGADQHWMVGTGIEDEDNDGEYDWIYVNDPGHSESNPLHQTRYSITQFKSVWRGTLLFWNNNQVGEYNDPYGWHNQEYYANGSTSKLPQEPSQPFVDTYLNNRGPDALGFPNGCVYSVYAPSGLRMWAQDFNYNGHVYTLFLNKHIYNVKHHYLGVVYIIHGRIKDYWQTYYNSYGPPVSNEYFEYIDGVQYVIQWFEPYEDSFVKITYNTQAGTFNDSVADNLEPGDHILQDRSLNSGYSENGYGMGGGDQPQPPPETEKYTLQTSAICEYVEPNSGYAGEPVLRQSFYTSEDRVGIYVKLSNINTPGLQFHWEWYTPSGKLWEHKVDELGYEEEVWHVYQFASISNAIESGQWYVDVFIDNEKVATHDFTVDIDNNPPSPPTNLRIVY